MSAADPPPPDATPSEGERFAIEWQPGRGIPWHELTFEQSLGGGPGGQHVNRTASRVTLIWVPRQSGQISPPEVDRIERALAGRMNQRGEVRVRSGQHRRVGRNKTECLDLLERLIRDALTVQRRRRPTRTPKSAHRKRMDQKNRRSQVKKNRQRPGKDD